MWKHTRSQFRGYKDCSRNIHFHVHVNRPVSFLVFVTCSFLWEEHVTPRRPLWGWNTWRGPFNLRGRPIFLPANGSITHEIVCCTLAVICKKNIDSLLLLPFKEKEGFSDGVFPSAEIKLAIKMQFGPSLWRLFRRNQLELTVCSWLRAVPRCTTRVNETQARQSEIISWFWWGSVCVSALSASTAWKCYFVFCLIPGFCCWYVTIRGTQRLFSVKYLLGEANIA